MKIELISYSQDVNILDPRESENFIVIGEEESRQTTRIPVPAETVSAIVTFVETLKEMTESRTPHPDDEQEPPEEEESLPDLHFDNTPVEEDRPAPVLRKRIVGGPIRPRASAAIQDLPSNEDEVPSL